mmetsp:Transcript_21880/g.44517  ORF Transcript_21880/g.44517 Transcript_21880/m.44517 type:complete len:535 (+) Transcript_21880:97-1701(+)
MTCQVAAANDPFYSKKYSTGTDKDDDAIAIRNGKLSSSGMMTMKNERAFGYYYRHAVESFDGCNESENHTNERNDNVEDDDLLPSLSSYSSTLSCPNSPGSFLSPTGSGNGNGNGTGKSRSIFASYWSSPKHNNTHRVMTTPSSLSGRGSENRKDNQTKDSNDDDDDDDVLSRLQSLALPLVEPPASPSTNSIINVNIDNDKKPTNIGILNDRNREYSHKVDQLEPSQQQQWKPAPAAANETTKGNPNTSTSSPLSLPYPSPRTRRQILPSPPPSPHFEPSPLASSPIRANMAPIDSPTTSSSWSSPSSSSSSTPPLTIMPGTTLTLSPPIYYPSSPYSPISLRESYRRTSSTPSSASPDSVSRPWSSTSALVKKRPSHSCLRRPRYSSFSSVEDTVSKSSSTRKPRSVSDADVILLSAAAPSRRDHRHGDAHPEEDNDDYDEEHDAIATTTHVQNARTPTSASNNNDTDEDEQQQQHQEEEESKSTSTSSELKKQVSFYSQVAVFEFAVVQNSQVYHPPMMDAKDGWSKYFGL